MSKDKVGAVFFLLLSLVYGGLAFKIPLTFVGIDEAFTARSMPLALALAGILVSGLILVLPSANNGDTVKVPALFRGLDWKRVGFLALTMIFYGLTIRWLGFVLSTCVFLIAGFWILGERRVKVLLLASIPLVIIFWLLMTKILGVYLDPGSLYFFMEDLLHNV